MKIAYFDCFHGAAGDMLLASMLDAGLDLAKVNQVLALLPLTGYTIEHKGVMSHHVQGSRVAIHVHTPQPSRTWADIRAMLEASSLPQRTRTWALAAFARLARAEAAVHGVPLDRVHFHEVGAIDSIVDMVGVCAALDLLDIEQVYASPLPTGSGWVETAHGLLPVPAPATLKVLAEAAVPIVPAASVGELLTPTAAALLAELAYFTQPPMQIDRVGYGFGHKTFARLNGLRVWIGTGEDSHAHDHDHDHAHEHAHTHDHEHTHAHAHTHTHAHAHDHDHEHTHAHNHDHNHDHTHDHEHTHAHDHTHTHDHDHEHAHDHAHDHTHAHDHDHDYTHDHEQVVELRCNLDDVTGEIIAYTIEQLLAAGALDAWATPLVMKKGRPALQLACLAHPADCATLAQLILRETPTLGVRWGITERLVAERQVIQVETAWGQVRLKQKLIGGKVVASMPEYEDCARVAQAAGVSLAQVYNEAHQANQNHQNHQNLKS